MAELIASQRARVAVRAFLARGDDSSAEESGAGAASGSENDEIPTDAVRPARYVQLLTFLELRGEI